MRTIESTSELTPDVEFLLDVLLNVGAVVLASLGVTDQILALATSQ